MTKIVGFALVSQRCKLAPWAMSGTGQCPKELRRFMMIVQWPIAKMEFKCHFEVVLELGESLCL